MKSFFYTFCYVVGITRLFYFLNKGKQRILNYHHILPEEQIENNLLFGYCHSVENFESQLQIIKKKWGITEKFGGKGAIITFDDGALNNYTNALPTLERLNIKAYFFIVNSQLSNNRLLWIDSWYLWLSKVPNGKYNIAGQEVSIQNKNDRLKLNQLLWGKITKEYQQKDEVLKEMDAQYAFSNFKGYFELHKARLQSVNEQQIDELKQKGHLVGWHSEAHDILSKIPAENLQKDIDAYGKAKWPNTKTVALPFGTKNEVDQKVVNTYLEAGCSQVLLNQEEPIGQSIGRMNLPNTGNSHEIHAHLSGLYYFIKNWKLLP